jgi:hypothetical protein
VQQAGETRAAIPRRSSSKRASKASFYVWTVLVLAVAVLAVVLGWHSEGGTPNPAALGPGQHMSRTTAVINSAILVFREGLETILVLAAVTASFLGDNRSYRRPVATGAGIGGVATIATWFLAIWIIGQLGGSGLDLQAATGIPAIIVLLLVMNWFFHRIYWTGWISNHHKRRRGLLAATGEGNARRVLLGLGLLGFTSIYREGFEIVLFLQSLRVTFGSSVVLEGVLLGCLFTATVGVLTFALHPAPALQAPADHHRCDARRRAVRDGRRAGQRDAARRLDRDHEHPRRHSRLGGPMVLDLPERRDDRGPSPRGHDCARLLPRSTICARLAPTPPRPTRSHHRRPATPTTGPTQTGPRRQRLDRSMNSQTRAVESRITTRCARSRG